MTEIEYTREILTATMDTTGFLECARSGNVDQRKYLHFRRAIEAWAGDIGSTLPPLVSRQVVAALFEVPWELENAASRLRPSGVSTRLDTIADELRMLIHDALWEGASV